MSPKDCGAIITRLATDFPRGCQVWHLANGKRGLVIGWQLTHTGTGFVVVDWGYSSGCEYPLSLSHAPVPDGGDGEAWKEDAH